MTRRSFPAAAPTRFNVIGDLQVTAVPADPKVLRTICLIGDTRIHVPKGTPVEFRALGLIGDMTVVEE